MERVMMTQGIGTLLYTVAVAILLWIAQSKYKQKYYVKVKMVCSVGFVVLGAVFAWASSHINYYLLLLPALCFCMLGDLFMGLYQIARKKQSLIWGIVTFMLGHLFLLINLFYHSRQVTWWNLFVPAVTVAVFFLMRKTCGMHYGKVMPLAVLYVVFLALMLSKSTELMVLQPGIATAWIGVGGIFFFISDFTINFIYFYKIKNRLLERWIHGINLGTYYLAILAFDMSILYGVI